MIAAACGVTAFAQQQLHSGGGFVGQSSREDVKRELMPKFASGELLCGVAFSHLRRPGPPMVRIEKVSDGYLVNGEAPWVSDWRFLDAFALGGTAPDGHIVYCYVPIAPNPQSVTGSPPVRTATMDAADTVKVTLANLIVPDEHMLFERDPDYMKRSDYCGITGHVSMPFGCTMGSVRLLRKVGMERNNDQVLKAADHFEAEIEKWRSEGREWNASRADEPEYRGCALAARAGAIKLALRAAEAAIAVSGGAAHLRTHPAQRRLREAAFYATVAQTRDTQAGFLEAVTYGG
jgi:alkylation response protein AidB-like acyl-CoA dehydrogenase